MADKIIKDIRYSESDIDNINGNPLPRNPGNIFQTTNETGAIGQRIARKLNELKFISGIFDHIDISFTTVLKPDEIKVSARDAGKWLIYVDYGVLPSSFNAKTEIDKNSFVKEITFKSLELLYSGDSQKLQTISEVRNLVEKYGSEIQINYKTKETGSYRIDISYQVRPNGSSSKAIILYLDKKTNFKGQAHFDLQFYDDIYFWIDTVSVKDNLIILNPKKSFKADIYNSRYKTPLQIDINELVSI